MSKKYESLVNEYAQVSCSIEYIRVLKLFDAEGYKNNKEEIEKQLEELEARGEDLLGLLHFVINNEIV